MAVPHRQVLLVDDDPSALALTSAVLEQSGFSISTATCGGEARDIVNRGFRGVIVLDVELPDVHGPDLLAEFQQGVVELPIIMLTAHGSADLALATITAGAHQFVEKAHLIDRLPNAVARAAALLEKGHQTRGSNALGFGGMVTGNEKMFQVFRCLEAAVDSKVPVLVRGESGTGKELIAKGIHDQGPRAKGPFIAVNCAGIPDDLLEAEMFGYEKGAFTGAVQRKLGRFDLARGGTLFLDEIGEMRPNLQAKLLRVLQVGEYQRLGGSETLRADVRIVSATHRDLEQAVADGRFREDLYYRLCVFTVALPPLRDRGTDLMLLWDHFVEALSQREGRLVPSIDAHVRELLGRHTFPGNVRELENIASYAVITAGDVITVADLPAHLLKAVQVAKPTPSATPVPITDAPFPTLAEMEATHVARAMALAQGNKTEAARLLGISRMRLYRKLDEPGTPLAQD